MKQQLSSVPFSCFCGKMKETAPTFDVHLPQLHPKNVVRFIVSRLVGVKPLLNLNRSVSCGAETAKGEKGDKGSISGYLFRENIQILDSHFTGCSVSAFLKNSHKWLLLSSDSALRIKSAPSFTSIALAAESFDPVYLQTFWTHLDLPFRRETHTIVQVAKRHETKLLWLLQLQNWTDEW